MTQSPLARLRTATLAASAAGLALFATGPVLADQADDTAGTELSRGEQRLQRMLEGRVAGEPQNCIRALPNQQITTIEGTAYVYGRGNTIYVQRTQNPEQIDRNETLVAQRLTPTRLCRQDIVTTIDPVLGFFTGAVFFDDFIPYTRVSDDESDG